MGTSVYPLYCGAGVMWGRGLAVASAEKPIASVQRMRREMPDDSVALHVAGERGGLSRDWTSESIPVKMIALTRELLRQFGKFS